MKLSQAKEWIALLEAAQQGKTIQTSNCRGTKNETWNDLHPDDDLPLVNPANYRIKPEPKLRPWKPEEVPVGCWLRSREAEDDSAAMTLRRDPISFISCWDYDNHKRVHSHIKTVSCEWAFHNLVHSTDNGKTWKPCGVEQTV